MRVKLGVSVLLVVAMPAVVPLERLGRMEHPAIREASGLVASPRHAGVFWVINDSGNPAALFAVKHDGSLVRELAVKVPNLDWEDLAFDGAGRLYIGDTGNNGLLLPRRVIYRLAEPDPAKTAAGPLAVSDAFYYRYPGAGRFDAEGFFIDRERAILVAKYLDGRDAELFAVPLDAPAPLLRPATALRLGRLPGCTEPVTGATLSADGGSLAVCSYGVVRVYERARRESDEWATLAVVPFDAENHGIEAISWDGRDLILAGESRGLFRIAERTWKQRTNR